MKNIIRKKTAKFFPFAFLITLFALSAMASSAYSLDIPERLVYDLTWTGVKAGEAVLETKDEGSHVQFISKANSAKWVSVFYHVEDIVVSTLSKEPNGYYKDFPLTPYKYRIKLKEGRHRRDKEVIFDLSSKKMKYINHLDNEKKEFDIGDSVFDPLSSFYYIRRVPLEVGKSIYIDIFDSKRIYKTEVQVLKKETIETPLGTFNTILIKPIMKSEGIFSRKGDILIWLTDDDKRLPVLLKTKVAVGSVKATLVNYTQ